MAYSDIEVRIANPAPKRKNKMAKQRRKKLSPAQIRAGFGGKRRKLAARSKHRRRTKPRKSNPARRKTTKRATARHVKRSAPRTKKRVAKKHRRRSNPMEIISWGVGNPAPKRSKKKGKSMARRKTTKRAVARHTGARHSKKQMTRRRRRSNPGNLGSMKDWVVGGAGVLAGVVVTRAVPQMVLGTSNAGPTGYLANVVTAVGAGWLSHMMFPQNRILTATVIAGGFATVISRIIADKTPFGAQLSLSGLGDWGLGLYQKSNFPYPPRVQNGRGPGSSMFTWGDGSQGLPAASFASAGSDSTGAC